MALFEKEMHMQNNISKYPNTFYRVTVKGIIRDSRGYVLAVKEYDSDAWSLPGGGIDHKETLEQALAREMYEEALIEQNFTANIIGIDSFFAVSKEAYLMWIVSELTFDSTPKFGLGVDANDVQFIDPVSCKNSIHRPERLIYKWCVDRTATFE